MSSVTVKNLGEVQGFLADLPADTFTVAKKEMARTLFEVDTAIKTNGRLKQRSGQLFKSIQTVVGGSDLRTLKASIFTDSVYANIHEHGGEVKAKNAYKGVPGGPYLNIPTKSNKTPAGVTRLQAREVFNRGGYIAKFKSGRYGVMMGGQLMFTLHTSVKIPKRLGMAETSEDAIPTMLSRISAAIGLN